MPIDRTTVLTYAPELAAIPADDARWTSVPAMVSDMLDSTVLGSSFDRVGSLLVAHYLTVPPIGITSQSVGPMSISYATATSDKDRSGWSRTFYGEMALSIIRTVTGGPLVA